MARLASDTDDFDQNIENLKATAKQSFTRIYASVKARELRTLRQLDAIRKQCRNEKRNCVQNIHVSYDNESTLLENISNYGIIDLEKLNFDKNTFTEECDNSPNDDHLYSYKIIEHLVVEDGMERNRAKPENCVCFMNVRSEDTSEQFRKVIIETAPIKSTQEPACVESKVTEDDKSDSSDPEVVKINPTDDWLNSIKSQTETEPSQVSDVMEHNLLLNN